MKYNPPQYWTIAAVWKLTRRLPSNPQAAEAFGETLVETFGMDRLTDMLTGCFEHLPHIPKQDLLDAWGAYTLKINAQLTL